MAISAGSVGHGMSAAITAAGTTLTKNPLSTIAPEKIIVMTVATRENVAVSTITDTSGNTWHRISRASHSANNAHVEVWICRVGTELTTSSVITVTFAGSVFDRQLGMREYTVAAGKTLALTPESGGLVTAEVTAANNYGSATISGLTSKQRLYYRASAKQANVTTDYGVGNNTPNFTSQGFTSRSRNNASAIIARAEARTNTSTGETSNPTHAASGNAISTLQAMEEVDAAPWISSVSPDETSPGSSQSVTIAGYAFRTGATVTLSRDGTDYNATSVSINSLTEITCTFPGLEKGIYDVIVANTDGYDSGTSGAGKYKVTVTPAIQTLLGDRFKLGFYGDYASGSWVATSGTDVLGQSSSGARPVLGTTPGGNEVLTFDGNDTLVASGFNTNNRLETLFNFPAQANYQRLFACVFRKTGTVSDEFGYIYSGNSSLVVLSPYGHTVRMDEFSSSYYQMNSDIAVNDSEFHRLIIISDDTNTITRMYIDGELQTETLPSVLMLPGDWAAGALGLAVIGDLGAITFAHTDAGETFSTDDIEDIDAALLAYIEGGGEEDVEGEATITGSSAISATLTNYNPVVETLGNDLLVTFAQSPNATSWSPDKIRSGISCTPLAQANSSFRPSVVSTPSGNEWLEFDGTDDGLSGATITGLPTYNGSSGVWGFACVFQRNGTGETSQQIIDFNGNDEMIVMVDGELYAGNAYANNPINQGLHRLIVIGKPTSGTASSIEIYLDGALQTAVQASGAPAFGSHFAGPHGIGKQLNNSAPFLGRIGCLTWFQASTFNDTRIDTLDTALALWYGIETGKRTATISNTCNITASLGAIVGLSATIEGTSSVTATWKPAQPSIEEVLGTRFKLGFYGNYASGILEGTVSDDKMGNSNPSAQPILGSTPGGNPVLVFDGNDQLAASGFATNNILNTLAAFPADSNYQRLFACVVRIEETLADTYAYLFFAGSYDIMINPYSGALFVDAAVGGYQFITSDAPVNDGEWHRIILVADDTTDTTRIYIDGELQSGTLNANYFLPGSMSSYAFGLGIVGEAGAHTFAHTEAGQTFSTDDIEDLDGALLAYIEGGSEPPPSGEISSTIESNSTFTATGQAIAPGEISATIVGTSSITGTIVNSSPLLTPLDVLGERLVLYFGTDYDAVTGIWQSEVGNEHVGQANTDFRPTAGTTPSGNVVPSFTAGDHLTAVDAGDPGYYYWTTLDNLPDPDNGERIIAYVVRANAPGYQPIFRVGDEISYLYHDGEARWQVPYPEQPAIGDNDICDGYWHRVIAHGVESTATVTLYIDGIPQAQLGTGVMGTYWGGYDPTIGWYSGGSPTGLDGELGSLTFAYTASTFSSEDITNLDTALLHFIEGAVAEDGEIESTINNTSTVTASVEGLAAMSASSAATSTVTGTINGTSNVSSSIVGTADIEASLDGYGFLSLELANTSEVSVTAAGIGSLSSTIDGYAEVSVISSLIADGSAEITGGATLSLTITAVGALSFTGNGSSTVAAQVSSPLNASSEIAGESFVSSSIEAVGQLTSTIINTSTITADIDAFVQRTATIAGTSELTATGSIINGLGASIGGSAAVTGSIVAFGDLSSSTINASSGLSANISGATTRSATIDGYSEIEASIWASGELALTISGNSTTEASVSGERNISATITNTSSINVIIAGEAGSSASITGSVIVASNISGIVLISAQVVGTSELITTPNADVFIGGTSTVSAQIRGSGALQSTISNVSDLTASIRGIIQRNADINGTSSVQAPVIGIVGSTSTISNTSAITAELQGTGSVTASSAGTSTITFVIDGSTLIEAEISNDSTVSAQIIGVASGSVVAEGTSTFAASALAGGTVRTTIISSSSVNASISATATSTSTIGGTSGHSAAINGRSLLQSIIINNAITNGQISGLANGIVTITGITSVEADIDGELTASAHINGFGNISVGIYAIQGVINGSSNVTGSIFNFLQDKQIIEIDRLNRSGVAFPRTLIPKRIKRALTPLPNPELEQFEGDSAIHKSGLKLAQQIIPGKIVKSDNSF